jgi:hypothetical protein
MTPETPTKLCPWCGGEPDEPHWEDEVAFVRCSKCRVRGPEFVREDFGTQTAWLNAAVAAWDRRAGTPDAADGDGDDRTIRELTMMLTRLVRAVAKLPDGPESARLKGLADLAAGLVRRKGRSSILRDNAAATPGPGAIERAAERIVALLRPQLYPPAPDNPDQAGLTRECNRGRKPWLTITPEQIKEATEATVARILAAELGAGGHREGGRPCLTRRPRRPTPCRSPRSPS